MSAWCFLFGFPSGKWREERSCPSSIGIKRTSPRSSRFWEPRSAPIFFSGNPPRKWRKYVRTGRGMRCFIIRRKRRDTLLGMGFSNMVAYFVLLATAATLHAHGVTQIETAGQAAQALRPLAGEFCFLLFAIGIIGTGLLAAPVLAGSAAFAVGEALRFRTGLEHKPMRAKRFYGVLIFAMLIGILLIYLKMNPIRALYWSAVINGIISAPIMIVIMLMASRPTIMGAFTISQKWRWLGWAATAVMTAAVVVFFVTL